MVTSRGTDTLVVCTDSLWDHTVAVPSSPKRDSQKIKFKTAIGCQGKLTHHASASL